MITSGYTKNAVNQLDTLVKKYLTKRKVYKRDIESIDSSAQTCVTMIDSLRSSVLSLGEEDFTNIDYNINIHLDQIRVDIRDMNYMISMIRSRFGNLTSRNDVFYFEYIDTVLDVYTKLVNTYIGQSCIRIGDMSKPKIAS